MEKIAVLPALAGLLAFVGVQTSAAPYADRVIAYDPGVGFARDFATGAGFTNQFAVLGEPSRETPGPFGGPVDPFNPPYLSEQLLSIGTGGSLVVAFDSPILDHPANPFGLDFIIYGNAGFVITNGNFSGGGITDGSLFGADTGESWIWVSADNENYFRLDPSRTPRLDAYFPTDGSGIFGLPVDPTLTPSDFSGLNLSEIRSLYAGSAGGTGFDLAWAVDANGNPAGISSISYIRIDVLGDSAEIDGIAAVPEPSAPLLILLGIGAFAFLPRRRSLGKALRGSGPTLPFLLSLAAPLSQSATIEETFDQPPAGSGWKIHGDASLFVWNSEAKHLEVTWDSSRPNSFFYYPLGATLSRTDDFDLGFDLTLSSVTVGVDPSQPFTFELAVGWIRVADATQPAFLRGTGLHSPNLVEWDYFPDSGFGPTISSVITSTNSRFSYEHSLLELAPGDRYRIELEYRATNSTLRVAIARNGEALPSHPALFLSPDAGDFQIDALAVSSYSDEGADGSILAQGTLDNIRFSFPAAVEALSATRTNGAFQLQFIGRAGYDYTIESTQDWRIWQPAASLQPDHSGPLSWTEENPSPGHRFFRVVAKRNS